MDSMLQTLLSWQFLLFCLSIAAITSVVRKISEYVLDNPKVPLSKESQLWTNLILPIFPVILGCGIALVAKMYPYPHNLTSTSGRVSFGLVAGLLSTFVYRAIRAALSRRQPTYRPFYNQINIPPPSNQGMGAGNIVNIDNDNKQ